MKLCCAIITRGQRFFIIPELDWGKVLVKIRWSPKKKKGLRRNPKAFSGRNHKFKRFFPATNSNLFLPKKYRGGQEINQGGKNENLGGHCPPCPPRWRCAWFKYRSGFDLSRAMIALLPQLSQILEPDRGPFRMSDLALSRWILSEWCQNWPRLLETHDARSGTDVSEMKWLSGKLQEVNTCALLCSIPLAMHRIPFAVNSHSLTFNMSQCGWESAVWPRLLSYTLSAMALDTPTIITHNCRVSGGLSLVLSFSVGAHTQNLWCKRAIYDVRAQTKGPGI